MANQKILVAFASKYGSTTQIAENIALRLKKSGCIPVVKDIKEISSLAGYSAVVVGSAVYAGSWLKEAANFLEKFQNDLVLLPTWFFSAGPTGKGDPVEQMRGWRFPDVLKPLAEKIGPRDIAFFHGVLDMSKLRLGEKLIVHALKAPVGDFRDWETINRWADQIARSLTEEQA